RMDRALATVALSVTPAMGGLAFYFGRRLKHRAQQAREVQSRMMSFVQQTLTAIPIVQAFGREERNRRHFQELAADAVAISQRGVLLSGAQGLASGLTTTAAIAVVLYAGGQRVLAGTLSVGSLLVFLNYSRALHGSVRGLLGTYVGLRAAEANVER